MNSLRGSTGRLLLSSRCARKSACDIVFVATATYQPRARREDARLSNRVILCPAQLLLALSAQTSAGEGFMVFAVGINAEALVLSTAVGAQQCPPT